MTAPGALIKSDTLKITEQVDTPPASKNGKDADRQLSRFNPVWLDDITTSTDPVYLIDGLMPAGPSIGLYIGPPKSLKSFCVKHAFLHISIGKPYCSRDVQHGATVYITSEGIGGVKRRLIAMRRHMGIEGQRIPFALIPAMPDLGAGADDLRKLIAEITVALTQIDCPLRAIAIDTLRRAIPGKSENEQKDVGVVIANCDALAKHFNCHVAIIHHSPRSDDKRSSGTNTLDAAADCMWSIVRENPDVARATITVVAMKDGQEGDAWSFELRPLDIGVDRNGSAIDACYVEITDMPQHRTARPASAKMKPPTAPEQRLIDIINNALIEAGTFVPDTTIVPANVRAITRDMLKLYCTAAGWWWSDQENIRRTHFSRALNALAGKRIIGLSAGYVWKPKP
jgi:hypothetical protein